MSDQAPEPVPPAPPAPAPAYVQQPQTSTTGVVGLVLAILSWVFCPIIAAIVALVLARSSDKQIAASQGAVGGSGLNTATRIIAWINIGVSILAGVLITILVALGVIFAESAVPDLDPSINSQTGLPDGMYSLSPSVRFSLTEGCTYGGTASMPGNIDLGTVTLYGTGPIECPDIVQVSSVMFEVSGGVARIISVQ